MTAPSFLKRTLLVFGSLSSLLAPSVAHAFTGLCDDTTLTPPGPDQCIAQIQAATGVVVNDVFTDSNGAMADQLPTYGVLFNQWPGCDFTSFAGCAGYDTPPYDCPGEYSCNGMITNTFAHASAAMAGPPDHAWWHPCRTSNHDLDANGCPQYVCVADGDASGYNPWEGLVFDLGGPSNKVAIFATNDHGPQPCESLEYTIYLSDNPFAKEKIDYPLTDGVDPQKWNRAVLNRIYTTLGEDPPDARSRRSCVVRRHGGLRRRAGLVRAGLRAPLRDHVPLRRRDRRQRRPRFLRLSVRLERGRARFGRWPHRVGRRRLPRRRRRPLRRLQLPDGPARLRLQRLRSQRPPRRARGV